MESHHLRRVLEANHELKLDLLAVQVQSEQCQLLEIQHDRLAIEQDQIAQMQMSKALGEHQQAEAELQQAIAQLKLSKPQNEEFNS